jgi:CRP-like cAMP-binding protein
MLLAMTKSPKIDCAVLSSVPLFRGVSMAVCVDALAVARRCSIPKDTAAFEQGDPADAFFLLAEGYMKAVQTTAAGQQFVLHYINPGEIFGCVALMGAEQYPATAKAVADSVALSWSLNEVNLLIQRHPTLSSNALAGFGGRLLDMQARLREIHTEPVEQRIAHALLGLVERSGRQVEAGVAVDFLITRQDVAELAGTTLHTVSRTLSRWGREGIVVNGRQKIVVADVARLASIAAGTGDSP